MDLTKYKIQICDDSILARKQLKDVLVKFGCQNIIESKDGQHTVDLYNAERPDILFMDIVMPGFDGIEAVKQIMAINSEAKIIMLSSVGTRAQIKAALEAGAKDFIQKPFKEDHVYDILKINLS